MFSDRLPHTLNEVAIVFLLKTAPVNDSMIFLFFAKEHNTKAFFKTDLKINDKCTAKENDNCITIKQ